MIREEMHRAGVMAAQVAAHHGYEFVAGSLDRPPLGEVETEAERDNRIAYRTGYLAELGRIANRKMTAKQRDLLIAHDRAATVFQESAAILGRNASQCDAFVRADLALFGLNPWTTLGLRLGQYDGPAAQAGKGI